MLVHMLAVAGFSPRSMYATMETSMEVNDDNWREVCRYILRVLSTGDSSGAG